MIIDGHVHTPFCPHGTTDTLKSYIENAILKNYQSITFAEHAPLPPSFSDPAPDKDSGMDSNVVEAYFNAITKVKEEYRGQIRVLAGMEVDFIEGYEEETAHLLDTYGPQLDDAVLSVHFLKSSERYHCIDFSPEAFDVAVKDFGSTQEVYDAYFSTVTKSVEADLGKYKPKRIGHMSLVRKFHKQFPSPEEWTRPIPQLLRLIKQKGYELDYNGAGMIKPLCGETYPPLHIANEAHNIGIPLVYGSDAHASTAIGQGYDGLDSKLING
ncbi:histidinol-phosphatase HisJ [Thalassobacillus hwangdonensis]|uniref:Histidinol-phosphatase n=1 Tax=Thalassobacillus hwangdonensis TaxID=546108 RepID=A0ABW3KZT1_9BACI